MTNLAVLRGQLTHSLGNAAHSGEHGFNTVPGLLKRVREEHAWERRLIVETGEEFDGFTTLREYVTTDPPKGLGTDIDTIRRLIANDPELLTWFEKSLGISQGQRIDIIEHHDNVMMSRAKQGNSKEYAIRSLAQEGHVELLNQVEAGKLSPSAAMKKAGLRKPRIEISLTNAAAAAQSIINHATPDFIDELRSLL